MLSPIVECSRCHRRIPMENFLVAVEEVAGSVISIRVSLVFFADCRCGRTISLTYDASDLSGLQKDLFTVASSAETVANFNGAVD